MFADSICVSDPDRKIDLELNCTYDVTDGAVDLLHVELCHACVWFGKWALDLQTVSDHTPPVERYLAAHYEAEIVAAIQKRIAGEIESAPYDRAERVVRQ